MLGLIQRQAEDHYKVPDTEFLSQDRFIVESASEPHMNEIAYLLSIYLSPYHHTMIYLLYTNRANYVNCHKVGYVKLGCQTRGI